MEIKYDSDWIKPENDVKHIWHLTDQLSQLQTTRNALDARLGEREKKTVIRIAHFDTGYNLEHATFPEDIIRRDLQATSLEAKGLMLLTTERRPKAYTVAIP